MKATNLPAGNRLSRASFLLGTILASCDWKAQAEPSVTFAITGPWRRR